jgi:hypothetical protein
MLTIGEKPNHESRPKTDEHTQRHGANTPKLVHNNGVKIARGWAVVKISILRMSADKSLVLKTAKLRVVDSELWTRNSV